MALKLEYLGEFSLDTTDWAFRLGQRVCGSTRGRVRSGTIIERKEYIAVSKITHKPLYETVEASRYQQFRGGEVYRVLWDDGEESGGFFGLGLQELDEPDGSPFWEPA